jgi:hypothetical protein
VGHSGGWGAAAATLCVTRRLPNANARSAKNRPGFEETGLGSGRSFSRGCATLAVTGSFSGVCTSHAPPSRTGLGGASSRWAATQPIEGPYAKYPTPRSNALPARSRRAPPTLHNGTPAANGATRDAHARRYMRPPTSPVTTRSSPIARQRGRSANDGGDEHAGVSSAFLQLVLFAFWYSFWYLSGVLFRRTISSCGNARVC